ncbi:TetR/AcrR family transcriptional regulator [Brevibacterium luteolum]|nr:helix-turn-helix domain-containing protein [Brevibacterium luteolum]MBM7529428.1 AcrR family transcriptional regulator [Brevibacterium luteolum]NNG80352.1 helix-turn-helix transcriptional regulator [Brevibacterium luteolum]
MTTRRTIQARDRAVLRRREILEAARHEISANGIIDVSMKRVALLAGCSVGTLYTYFGSRFSTAERRAFADQMTHLYLRATGENC